MNPHLCMACWECVEKCPKQVIGKTGFFLHKHVVFENADACIGCLKCIKTCPNGAFLASAITGIGLHIAGHGTSHEVWHNWGAAHTLASFLWLLSTAIHVKRHRLWYKTLVSKGITNHRWVTILLSVLFPIVAITGIWLIACVKGAHTPIGLLHYKLGILLLVSSLIHALHRK